METICGIVNNVRSTISVDGGGNHGSVTTTYITIFQINGRQIKVKTSDAIIINDGDKIFVVGKTNGSIFNAFACKNITTGEEGNLGWVGKMVMGIIFPIAGVLEINQFSNPFFGIFPLLLGLIFIGVGMYLLYSGSQVSNAVKELRKLTMRKENVATE